jgi:hypothetical protein
MAEKYWSVLVLLGKAVKLIILLPMVNLSIVISNVGFGYNYPSSMKAETSRDSVKV